MRVDGPLYMQEQVRRPVDPKPRRKPDARRTTSRYRTTPPARTAVTPSSDTGRGMGDLGNVEPGLGALRASGGWGTSGPGMG
jgi:hypothetical protein